jgi:dihydrofolate reductase
MRKIVLVSAVSLDGFFEGPDRDISWHCVNEEYSRHLNEQFRLMGAFLFGRVTYELMTDSWSTAEPNPDLSPAMADFAGIWHGMPKIVFSRTLMQAGGNTTVLHDVVPEKISALKEQPGGDMILSGATLASAFLRHGLIDEFRIYVHPVVLGNGRPLFQSPAVRMNLRLEGTRTFGNGVVGLHYSGGA